VYGPYSEQVAGREEDFEYVQSKDILGSFHSGREACLCRRIYAGPYAEYLIALGHCQWVSTVIAIGSIYHQGKLFPGSTAILHRPSSPRGPGEHDMLDTEESQQSGYDCT
jgi:hypothetical protein